MRDVFQRNTRGHWRHCGTCEPWQCTSNVEKDKWASDGQTNGVSEVHGKERAELLPHRVLTCCGVFYGTWLCSKTKCCSKHSSGLEHMHWEADFHLFNCLQAPCAEERNLSLKVLLLRAWRRYSFHSWRIVSLTQAEDVTFVPFF